MRVIMREGVGPRSASELPERAVTEEPLAHISSFI